MARALLAPLVLVLVLLASGCGIGPDEAPQAISPSSLPPALSNTQTGTTTATGETATIFLVTGQGDTARLAPAEVNIDPALPDDRTTQTIRNLFSYTADQSDGLTSRIGGTELRSTKDLGSATIEISLGSFSVEGRPLQLAMAQIVYTATEGTPYNRVRLVVNDKPVPLADGSSDRALTRDDFAQFSPSSSGTPPSTRLR